jgi:hypothetical protein
MDIASSAQLNTLFQKDQPAQSPSLRLAPDFHADPPDPPPPAAPRDAFEPSSRSSAANNGAGRGGMVITEFGTYAMSRSSMQMSSNGFTLQMEELTFTMSSGRIELSGGTGFGVPRNQRDGSVNVADLRDFLRGVFGSVAGRLEGRPKTTDPGLDGAETDPEMMKLLALFKAIYKDDEVLEEMAGKLARAFEKLKGIEASYAEVSITRISISFKNAGTPRAETQPGQQPGNAQGQPQSDPLVLDVDGDGIELTGVDFGVRFDIAVTGQDAVTSFATGGDAFLAMDRNGNGRIDDGRELFGDQNGASDGFMELAKYDGNADGVIDASDVVFKTLRLLDMVSTATGAVVQRLRTLQECDVASIMTGASYREYGTCSGDRIVGDSSFVRGNGSTGVIVDAMLRYRPV